MSKAFSEQEKTLIVEKLRTGAMDCMQHYGIRKTSVDELVKIAGISKGAFYTFYPSKEILFFEAITIYQEKIQNNLIQKVEQLATHADEFSVSTILFDAIKEIGQSFLLSVMGNGDLEYLERKLPAKIMIDHQLNDDDVFKRFCTLLPNVNGEKTELFSAALRAIVLTMLHKQAIGETIYDEVLQILILGVVKQLFQSTDKG
jgi:AcrR family transcriptional regulator